ncbi:MAG: hypothetical protein M1812_001517 [Candelaria pacifica]|nr:MAG: hypothetical protein M1812_001517 [Candelaria pacifica]
MDVLQHSIRSIILDPKYADLLSIVKAARNGAVYGAKVRFPHALVMVFLFRSGTIREKIRLILKATRQHARNLATFATIYKTSMLIQRYLNPMNGGKEGRYDTFVAGLIGGYAVFGRGIQSSVNQQIVIYVFARVVLALAKLSVAHIPRSSDLTLSSRTSLQARLKNNAWPVFASLSWAYVMYLFRWYPDMIQPSMRSSMKYMYVYICP